MFKIFFSFVVFEFYATVDFFSLATSLTRFFDRLFCVELR
jgi:hypothetical protein